MLCLCYARLRLYLRFFAFALQRESALRRCASLRIYALANRRASMPLHFLGQPGLSMPSLRGALPVHAFAMHSRAARICSTPLRCLAAHTTPSLAFAFRHEALHCLCFAYRGKSDPSDLRLSTPLRCAAFQLSLAFAPRCTAVTTCAPAEQTCQHNAVAELCAHIRAFANHIIAVADQILSMQCRCSVDDVKGEAALAAVSPLANAAQNAVIQPL